jgi:hypothetical protein
MAYDYEQKFSKLYGSKYHSAADQGGEPWELTVTRADYEHINDPRTGGLQEKLVVYCDRDGEAIKPCILNVTNAKAVAEGTGTKNPKKWAGTNLLSEIVPVNIPGQGKGEGYRLSVITKSEDDGDDGEGDETEFKPKTVKVTQKTRTPPPRSQRLDSPAVSDETEAPLRYGRDERFVKANTPYLKARLARGIAAIEHQRRTSPPSSDSVN